MKGAPVVEGPCGRRTRRGDCSRMRTVALLEPGLGVPAQPKAMCALGPLYLISPTLGFIQALWWPRSHAIGDRDLRWVRCAALRLFSSFPLPHTKKDKQIEKGRGAECAIGLRRQMQGLEAPAASGDSETADLGALALASDRAFSRDRTVAASSSQPGTPSVFLAV